MRSVVIKLVYIIYSTWWFGEAGELGRGLVDFHGRWYSCSDTTLCSTHTIMEKVEAWWCTTTIGGWIGRKQGRKERVVDD